MLHRNSNNSNTIKMGLVHFLLESQFWFPIWVIFLMDRNFSLNQIVVADMVFRTSIVILEFPLGVLGDKIGRKKTYFLGAMFGAITYFILIITTNFFLLILCWILWAFFLSLISGTNTAYRYELLATGAKRKKDIHIFGFFNSIAAAALVISHTSAGYLYSIKPTLPIWINLGFALLGAILILTLPRVKIQSHKTAPPSLKKLWSSFIILFKKNSKVLPLIFILALWTAYHWTPTLIFQPLFKELGLPKSSFGLIFALFTGMGIISGLITGRLSARFGKFKIIIIGLLFQVIAVSLTAFGREIYLIIAGIIILRFAYNLAEPILSVLLNREISDNIRASVISIVNLVASLIMIFSRPLIGLVAGKYTMVIGFRLWFFVGIGFLLLSAYLLIRVKKKIIA